MFGMNFEEIDNNKSNEIYFSQLDEGKYQLIKNIKFGNYFIYKDKKILFKLNSYNGYEIIQKFKEYEIKSEELVINNKKYDYYNKDLIVEKKDDKVILKMKIKNKNIEIISSIIHKKIDCINKEYIISQIDDTDYSYIISNGEKLYLKDSAKKVFHKLFKSYYFYNDNKFYYTFNNEIKEVQFSILTYDYEEFTLEGKKCKTLRQNLKVTMDNICFIYLIDGTSSINYEEEKLYKFVYFYLKERVIYGFDITTNKFYRLPFAITDLLSNFIDEDRLGETIVKDENNKYIGIKYEIKYDKESEKYKKTTKLLGINNFNSIAIDIDLINEKEQNIEIVDEDF